MSVASSHSVSASDIDSLLVTEENPARSDDTTLDFARCAALHNYIVQYGWIAGGHSLDDLPRQSYWEQLGDEDMEEYRHRINPSLQAFLRLAIGGPDISPALGSFFFWVDGLLPPSDMFKWAATFPENLEEQDPDRVVTLYDANGMEGHKAGLMYDQKRHRAFYSMTIWEFDYASPISKHEDMWHPLETVLSNWIQMIRIGKITALDQDDEAQGEKYGVWALQSYGERQVDSTVKAFHRLVDAIEDRMPLGALLPAQDGFLLENQQLDAAFVPTNCFIRSFLSRARKPRFNKIAPGLLVPHDHEAFIAGQRFTNTEGTRTKERAGEHEAESMDRSHGDDASENSKGSVGELSGGEEDEEIRIPPVLIFPAEYGQTVNLDLAPTDHGAQYETSEHFATFNPFCQPWSVAVKRGDHSTAAGLYSESVQRSGVDIAEEGFRLLLPFPIHPFGQDVDQSRLGARRSDGSLIEAGDPTQLFQHGIKPFGGDGMQRVQRLERLFEKWAQLVEDGIWTIGKDGVNGGIEQFREADGPRWRHYWISPTW